MPPCCASAIARCDSVTVSMAAETIGIFKPICRVRKVRVSVSAGTTSLRAGSRRTSSKVRPSGRLSWIIGDSSIIACRAMRNGSALLLDLGSLVLRLRTPVLRRVRILGALLVDLLQLLVAFLGGFVLAGRLNGGHGAAAQSQRQRE